MSVLLLWQSPLELSIFPALLLGSTLFRLVLNVATTRLILTAGDRASNADRRQPGRRPCGFCGFSEFVTKGSLTVGVIIFIIMVVIQFVVIVLKARHAYC